MTRQPASSTGTSATALDLGWLCCNSWRFGVTEKPVGGFGTYADLLAGYHSATGIEVDPQALEFWVIFASFYWAVGCLTMVARHRQGDDPSVERIAIGRRSSECQFDLAAMLLGAPLAASVEAECEGEAGYPAAAELAADLARFLHQDIAPAQEGRLSYLARVAANTASILEREQRFGDAIRLDEQTLLRAMNIEPGSLGVMRTEVGRRIEDGSFALDDSVLSYYLRRHAANQLAVDQPRYRGMAELEYASVKTMNI